MMETSLTSPKSSPLVDAQKSLNAQFSDVSGWTMARTYGDPVQEHQAVRERVGLIDLSYYGVIKVGGREAAQFLNGLVTNDVKTLASHTGESGYDLLIPDSGLKDIWDFILLKGAFHGLAPVGLDALNALRIEAGIPAYGIDVDESNMMLELGMADAVSFTKGCYTGQEAVAMATYRGHISKKLSGLLIEGDRIPIAGSKISKDGKEIGQVTSAIPSISIGGVIALAYIKYGFF